MSKTDRVFNRPQYTNPNYGQGAIDTLPNLAVRNVGQITSVGVNPSVRQFALNIVA